MQPQARGWELWGNYCVFPNSENIWTLVLQLSWEIMEPLDVGPIRKKQTTRDKLWRLSPVLHLVWISASLSLKMLRKQPLPDVMNGIAPSSVPFPPWRNIPSELWAKRSLWFLNLSHQRDVWLTHQGMASLSLWKAGSHTSPSTSDFSSKDGASSSSICRVVMAMLKNHTWGVLGHSLAKELC